MDGDDLDTCGETNRRGRNGSVKGELVTDDDDNDDDDDETSNETRQAV